MIYKKVLAIVFFFFPQKGKSSGIINNSTGQDEDQFQWINPFSILASFYLAIINKRTKQGGQTLKIRNRTLLVDSNNEKHRERWQHTILPVIIVRA